MSAQNQHKREVLASLEAPVAKLVAAHIEKRGELWMPTEVAFPPNCHDDSCLEKLRSAANDISLPLRAVYALNLLTEEGLPSYFQLLAEYLDLDSPFRDWIYRWTAEEDRHGQLLYMLAAHSRLIPFPSEFEKQRFRYISAGFRPRWEGDPYRLLAYTAIQEEATKVSHGNLSAKLKEEGHVCFVRPLALIAAEENHHARFYGAVVKQLFERDPEAMLCSLYRALVAFAMPGQSMPHYTDLAAIAVRLRIFTIGDLRRILIGSLRFWAVEGIVPRTQAGIHAKSKLFALLPYLEKLHKKEMQVEPRTFFFPFLGEPFVV